MAEFWNPTRNAVAAKALFRSPDTILGTRGLGQSSTWQQLGGQFSVAGGAATALLGRAVVAVMRIV
jgi:hypothetical protein